MIHVGNCLDILPTLEAGSVQTCVTSPPYFGLRDYGLPATAWPAVEYSLMPGLPSINIPAMDCCLGLESDPLAFIGHMVQVFREVHRVLRDDGTLWLNLGDSYAGACGQTPQSGKLFKGRARQRDNVCMSSRIQAVGCKSKDLMGMPWLVAFALRADGWYLRQEIIWSKPNPMPESVTDRCTKAHEHIFLLAKQPKYYFDAEAIKEPCAWDAANTKMPDGWDTGDGGHGSIHRNGREKGVKVKRPELARGFRGGSYTNDNAHNNDGDAGRSTVGNNYAPEGFKRNKRSVWTVGTQPFKEAHFATFPPTLIEPCILAGSKPGQTVLDPFGGAGTTATVCERLGREWVICELKQDYADIAARRIRNVQPGLGF